MVEGQLDLDPDKLVFIDETGRPPTWLTVLDDVDAASDCAPAFPFTAGLRRTGMVAPLRLEGR